MWRVDLTAMWSLCRDHAVLGLLALLVETVVTAVPVTVMAAPVTATTTSSATTRGDNIRVIQVMMMVDAALFLLPEVPLLPQLELQDPRCQGQQRELLHQEVLQHQVLLLLPQLVLGARVEEAEDLLVQAEHRVPAEPRALGEEEVEAVTIVTVIVPVIHHHRPHQYQSSPMFAICFHPALTRVWTVMVNIFIYLIVSAI